ncbi:hypothetical protein [Paenibacillus sp. MDMC362]|uniref:hypothetical protein n=1 Tax=Paenibacillus sp. MDMC362 TaxID=2977365 RepID=UPI0035943412
MLGAARSDGEQEQLQRKLNEKHLRLQLLMEQRGLSGNSAFTQYESKVRELLTPEE